jgi:hypothetical protein
MLRDVIESINYSLFAELALGLFVLSFGLLCFAVCKLSRSSSERFASIPLSDFVEDPRDE